MLLIMDHETRWEMHMKALAEFIHEYGHARVPTDYTDPGGVALGNWVSYMRSRYRQGKVPEHRIQVMDTIPSWEWGPLPPGPQPTHVDRDTQIREMRSQGASLAKIGDHFGLTRQRVHQILNGSA